MGRGTYCRANAKFTTDDFRSISIAELKREKALCPGRHDWVWRRAWGGREITASITFYMFSDHITFRYCAEGMGEVLKVDQTLAIVRTPCNYGGHRLWFQCKCGRRISRIFLTHCRVACRHCLNLAYPSQAESFLSRAFAKWVRCRDKLGGDEGTHRKPKHMHRRTWYGLLHRYDQALSLLDESSFLLL